MEPEDFVGYSFEWALDNLKHGVKVCRTGWNGKGMWIELRALFLSDKALPYIQMKTVDDKIIPWVASHSDLLAEDWQVVED